MDIIIANILFSVLICEVIGFIGSIFYSKEIEEWHQNLKKPKLYPPGWIILPLRTFLFLLMGIGFSKILNIGFDSPDVKIASISFAFQMILSVAWTFIFFGLRKIGYAFLVVILVILSIVTNIILFNTLSPFASYFLIPYLFWTLYMSTMNLMIFIMNLPPSEQTT